MILNISGRTDIVNYYTPWLLNRLSEGYVYSRNPQYKNNIYKISLKKEDVDCIIFCSKNYKPIINHIDKINKSYNIICHYTITSYGNDIEPNVPSIDESIETLIELSNIIGKQRVIWRFDPIILTDEYTIDYHLQVFEKICEKIVPYVNFCIFSFVDMYKRLDVNMPEIIPLKSEAMDVLLENLSKIAGSYDLKLQCCGSDADYTSYGINNSSCTTVNLLEDVNGVKFKNIKTANLRKGCHCVKTRDIGAYDTCPNSCKYCYANKNPKIAIRNYKFHDKDSKLLIGKVNKNDKIIEVKNEKLIIEKPKHNLDQWFS